MVHGDPSLNQPDTAADKAGEGAPAARRRDARAMVAALPGSAALEVRTALADGSAGA